jgi:Family of unknown function (DUF5677)
MSVNNKLPIITIPDIWERGGTLVDPVLNARDESTSVLASASEEKLVAEPTIGIVEQLLDRAYEHVAASVVCFATKNGATAEIAARAAMEASTNVRNILAGDRNSRVLAWLRAFLVQDSKQINNWERPLSNHSTIEAEVHRERIQRRRRVREQWEELVKRLELEFATIGVNHGDETWPKRIETRFEAIGELLSYRIAYARMSSQTHADAEATLSYVFFTVLGDEQLLRQMSLEVLAFSEYLVHYGAHFYLKALLSYSAVFGGSKPEVIREEIGVIAAHMEAIGDAWGW